MSAQIIWSAPSPHRSVKRYVLAFFLCLILITNFSLTTYGVWLDKATSPPYSQPSLASIISLFVIMLVAHLPMVVDLVNILRHKPLALFGTYLISFSLWFWTLVAAFIALVSIIFNFLLLFGYAFAAVLLGDLDWAVIRHGSGLPLLFWAQVGFWYLIAPFLILPFLNEKKMNRKQIDYYLHPELKVLWVKFVFFAISFGYLLLGSLVSIELTARMVPADSPLWDSWWFN